MAKQNAFNSIPYSTTRDTRVLPQLIPETIGLDQRSLAVLIAEIQTIAKNIPFGDSTATALDTWQQFLNEDVLFFLVDLQQFSIEKINQKTMHSSAEVLETQVVYLIQTIDRWYRKAISLKVDSLVFELENAIHHQFKKSYHTLKTATLPPLHKIWHTPLKEDEKEDASKITPGKSISQILDTILYIQKISKDVFEKHITKNEISKPHIALILSFLKLYKHIQHKFNGLTKKHLDYYFETLLKQSKKVNEPERTHVFFELVKGAGAITLPDQTVLFGGIEENGTDILFKTVGNFQISKANLTDLITIYIASNSHVSPHNKAGLITGIYQNKIQEALQLNPNNAPLNLFGQDGFEATSLNPIVHSEIGWAVSAPIFMLKEGVRKITVHFNIEKESLAIFKEQLQKITKHTGTEEKVWIHRFFNQTFNLSLTTNEGWFAVTQFFSTIEENKTKYQLSFSFSLKVDVPSITPYHKEIHKGSYETAWPVLKITLNKHKVYYPYSFLKHAKINSIHTKVAVQELQDLEVYDQYGKQDISKPFYLFGSQAGRAAACYIGYDEWRYKNLTSLDFDVQWHQITNTNFKAIYKQYPEKVDTNSFKFNISSLSNRQWKTSKASSLGTTLFHTIGKEIGSQTSVHIDDPTILKMTPDFEHKEVATFNEAKNGYFKWQLTAPSFGFGHGIYPTLVNEKIVEITRDPKKAKKKNIQVPQIPFSPEVQSISANYTAAQEFILHSDEGKRTDKRFPFELFHIHPFGLLSTATQTYVKDRALLPYFEDRGYLYMGIKEATPLEELSFYFKIETQRVGTISKEPLVVRWEYLLGDSWKKTPSTFLLYDGTDNFQHSGIIRIKIPKHTQHQHPLFENEKTWLRLSVPNTVNTQLGKVVCIQLNGVEAIREIKKNKHQTTLTKANAIKSAYTSIPTVKSISQPFIPTGGVTTEKQPDFYTRVSERLFHKKRGVLPSDFEVLILDAFSEVYQVSCFPSTMFPKEVPPGTIQIMVLPFIYEDTPVGDRKFNGYSLHKIKEYVASISMHHKALVISNPFYETIRVSCSVTFFDTYETGMALQKLIITINRFIAPWILQRDEKNKDTNLDNQILHPSSLSSYLLALPEVQAINGLSMVQIHQFEKDNSYAYKETSANDTEGGLQPTKPWSVFVPSTEHAIDIVNKPLHNKTIPLQIGTMEIENDFILKKQHHNEDNREQ